MGRVAWQQSGDNKRERRRLPNEFSSKASYGGCLVQADRTSSRVDRPDAILPVLARLSRLALTYDQDDRLKEPELTSVKNHVKALSKIPCLKTSFLK